MTQRLPLTDAEIDALCAPGRAQRWHGDGRQYDRDTARLIEAALATPQAAAPSPAPAPSVEPRPMRPTNEQMDALLDALDEATSEPPYVTIRRIVKSWMGAAAPSAPAREQAEPPEVAVLYLQLTDAMHYEAGPGLLSPEEYAADLYRDAMAHRAAGKQEAAPSEQGAPAPATRATESGAPLVTFHIEVARDGSITSDVQTHDNSYSDVAVGLAAAKSEIERVFAERKSCPHYPTSAKAAHTKIVRLDRDARPPESIPAPADFDDWWKRKTAWNPDGWTERDRTVAKIAWEASRALATPQPTGGKT